MPCSIAIVGGGIAGLALARSLERAKREGRIQDLKVTIYEQREDELGIQRYPIHLDPDGRDALRGILDPPTYTKLVEVASQGIEHGGISLFTPRLSKLFGMKQYRHQQPQFGHRWLLKEILSEDVQVVRGRRVHSVVDMGDKVKLSLDNGVTQIVDLVVGADGVGSDLRASLYPSHTRFERLPYLNIQMKLSTPLDRLPPTLDRNGINAILGTRNYSLLLVPFHGEPLPACSTYTGSDDSLEKVQKANDQPRPQYLFAILTIRCFDKWQDLTDSDWRLKTVQLLKTDKTDSLLVEAFEHDVIPGTVGAPWQVVSCDPEKPVPYNGGRVVLIGDAAHAMPPQAGAGASTALMDAYKLAESIVSVTSKGTDPVPRLSVFHDEMTRRAIRHVKDARRRLYLSNRSGWGVVTQRLLLRVMNVAWWPCEKLIDLRRVDTIYSKTAS